MRTLLILALIVSLAGCVCDKDHAMIRQDGRLYIVKKTSIVHKENGCISFPYRDGEESNTVEVCGSYTIENSN